MDICKIEGATRVLGAPKDWDHSKAECQGLPVIDRPDGWTVSQWKPNELEIETLRQGGTLLLWVYGTAHPVVGIDVSDTQGARVSWDAPETIRDQLAHRNAEVKLLRLALTRLQGTLGDQQRICDIALAATGAQDQAGDL